MRKLLFSLAILLGLVSNTLAQIPSSNLPSEVKAEDATITKFGHATMTVAVNIVTDTLTRRTDTLREVIDIEWDTQRGTAKQRNTERGLNPNGSGFYNGDSNWWLDIYYYSYNYPSINAEGQPVLLSAMACMPDEDCDYINNVIIGCHVTITSNAQCPSEYVHTGPGGKLSDVGMLMNHASSGMVFHSLQSDRAYYNLVIMPDYEGYGITRSHAHPYLYQELTARQVVDGVRYGIALYKNSPKISDIRHRFRDGWRSICVGYSQGGSVAMATQRFIEQNGLSNELRLAGSVCGDGPYDPIATLMYYVKQYNDGDPMSMPVVLPLILKGMCDYNPYMKNHQVSDYLKQEFLDSGILSWLTDKEKSTDDITSAWINYYRYNFPTNWNEYVNEAPSSGILTLTLKLNQIMTPEGLAFFQQLYNDYHNSYTSTAGVPLPTQRGLMFDLQYALASNNLTKGWAPQHAVFLYHSNDDSVVPEVNRESAGNSFGQWVIKLHASGAIQFDHVGTGRQFYLGTAEAEAIRMLSKAPVNQTIQHAIDMKNNISTGAHTLDPWDNPPTIHNNMVLAPLTLNGVEINAEYRLLGNFARLGSGNNACIPQYSVGKVEVPASITVDGIEYPVNEVAAVAFRMCSHITEVVLPEGIYDIGNFAFQGCQALTTVSLPSTLSNIGSGAFINLPRLDRVDLQTPPSWDLPYGPPHWLYNDVFKFHTGGIGDNAHYTYDILLCVPDAEVQTYQQAYYSDPSIGWTTQEGWGNFTNIVGGAAPNAEAYATYKNGTLTFYYDTHRQHRYGMETYGFTPEEYASYLGLPGWLQPMSSHANDITTVVFTPLFSYARPVTTSKWFQNCVNLDTIIGMNNLNTEMVTDMSFMFYNCHKLTDDDLDFSNFNTVSVTSMKSMFYDCVALVAPDFSSFNTRVCTEMDNMFYGCTGLTSLDLSMFETTDCSFNSMFSNCYNLESLNMGSFGVTNTYVCNEMFKNCRRLHELVIPSAFNKLTEAFAGCDYLFEVYCYKPEPFEVWRSCDVDFNVSRPKYTRFHVLAEAYDAWVAQYGDANVTFVGDLGTEDNPILIYSITDWNNLRDMVQNDRVVCAKMMNDINVTTMMGSYEHPFIGVFDGNGHTLHVDYNIPSNQTLSNDFIPAPFSFIQNAEIKNLKVEGNITVAATPTRSIAGGLVGCCKKESDYFNAYSTITNCHVSTEIIGNIKNIGGIIGKIDDHVVATVSGCLFDGSLSANHDYYLLNTINAGAIACVVENANLVSINNCVERGSYPADVSHKMFCPTTVTPINGYCFTPELEGHAKHAYSITTDTEGLLLNFGTVTATYNVSGITAYNLGLKLDDVFHAGTGQNVLVEITAPGYEYYSAPTIRGTGATISTTDNVNYTVTLGSADAVISLSGMVFTTVILYDDATDNSLTLERYFDQTYNVQLKGRTLFRSYQWNSLCLPFDVPNLNGTPLQGARLKVLDTITFENKVAFFHFKDTTAITADKPYLVQVRDNVEDPIFHNVRIKRSLPPGMKVDVGDNTQTGFVVEGNYNRTNLRDISGTANNYIALFFDRATLRPVTSASTLNAFRCYFEVCVSLNELVAAVLDIEGGDSYLAILDYQFAGIENIFIHDGNWNDDENWATKTIPSLGSKVLIEASATIPAGCVAEAREIFIDRSYILIKDGGQLVHNSWGLQVNVEKTFNPYHPYLEKDGYYLITNPVEEAQNPEYLNDMVMDFGLNGYDLYYFDQSERLEWRNYKQVPFDLENGKGYLYASQSFRDIEFSGRIRPANADVSVPVTYDDNAEFKGFNLIGNPFVCNAYLADGRDFYVLSEDGDEVVVATDDAIAPMQGLFVQTEDYEYQVTFTTTAPAKSKALTLSLMYNHDASTDSGTTSTTIDNARVRFDGGGSLHKFQLNSNHSKVYIPQGGIDYAVVSTERQGELPVNFKAQKNGMYTLSVNAEDVAMNYLHLIDNMTGADIDLLALRQAQGPAEYTFEARTTDYESRFKLVFVCGDANDDNGSLGLDNFAFINNGNVIITADMDDATLQIVDVMGHVIVSRKGDVSGNVSTSGMPAGVYVLRLIKGNDVMTQKIVID